MNNLLTKQNLEYKEKAHHIAEKYIRPIAAELDRTGEYPWSALKALRNADLFGLLIPPDYGGKGAGVLDLVLVVEELSRACGGVGICYAVNSLGTLPVLLSGTEEQKKKYLPRFVKGEEFTSFCLSEKNAGSDAGSLKVTALKENDCYIIDGDKKWTTNAEFASVFTVFAATNSSLGTYGLSAFIVEKEMEGFSVGKREDLMGIRCVPVNETHFQNVHVPVDNLIGGSEGLGFSQAMITLDYSRPAVAAQALGLAQGAFELAVNYARNRVQFGQPIVSNQAIQFMIADMATRIEASRQLVYTAARALDSGSQQRTKLASMAKVFATDTAMWVTTEAVQIFGGYGYCRDYPIEKYMRDAKVTQIYEGTNQIQRMIIGRAVLREASDEEKK